MKITRNQDEIAERVTRPAETDTSGLEATILIGYLDHAHALPFLRAGVSEETWEGIRQGPKDFMRDARVCHRHGSVSVREVRRSFRTRSIVTHSLIAYAWLAGLDDIVAALNAVVEGPHDIAPPILAFGRAFGFDQET